MRWLPGLLVLRQYELRWLPQEIFAGLVLTTMLANQHHRRARCHALRQDPQLLLDAPASPPFRPGENLAPHLPSPHMSTPEILIIDQRSVVHRTTAQTKATESRSPQPRQDAAQLTLTFILLTR